jgi:hypothetical protein
MYSRIILILPERRIPNIRLRCLSSIRVNEQDVVFALSPGIPYPFTLVRRGYFACVRWRLTTWRFVNGPVKTLNGGPSLLGWP